MDLQPIWHQLQKQTQLFERLRLNFREQFMAMEQLLDPEVLCLMQRQMQSLDQLCIQLQEQFWGIEQLRLKTKALSPTQLKLMPELKWQLEQLNKLALYLYRRQRRLWMRLMTFMLVELPIYMLLSLRLLPLLVRASKSLPEEATADLAALRQRLKRSRKNPIYIQLRTAWHFLEILWAFYIKIKIDNLWLPKKSSTIQQGVDIVVPDKVTSLDDIKAENTIFVGGGLVIGGSVKLEPIDD